MIALAYVLFFSVYLLVSICVVHIAYKYTKRHYQRGWVGGWLAAFVMYNLVFWDWIPVLLMHKYYCATQAGFWVYEIPEQWIKENPEVMGEDWTDQSKWKTETLNPSYEHHVYRRWLSPSVYYEVNQQIGVAHAIYRTEEQMIDTKSGQQLSKAIEFYRGDRGFGGSGTLTDFKIWLGAGKRSCGPDRDVGFIRDFDSYLKQLIQAKQKEGE